MTTNRPSKYDPLIAHLASQATTEVALTFEQLAALLGEPLPRSAMEYAAWWANSPSDPTHSWARRWTAAGWRAQVDLANQRVTFERAEAAGALATRLTDLRPKRHEPVMDLVQRAGVDVSDWSFTGDGAPVENPRANPSYCYNWSFGSPQEGYVLCLWYDELEERGTEIFSDCGMSHHRQVLEQLRSEAVADNVRRSRLNQQIRRARDFEQALEDSWRRGQGLQVIINAGNRREDAEIADTASRVAFRALDDERWYIHGHDAHQGRWHIVRGIPAGMGGEAESPPAEDDASPGADDYRRLAAIRVRRGQAKFRADLLGAYGGKCAVTGTSIEDLLEAAHIVPHAWGTDYRVSNGLLLRADIHTLYDLHLLSVDERYRVHVAKRLQMSEYRLYHGATLRVLPATSGQQPSALNLKARHERFMAADVSR